MSLKIMIAMHVREASRLEHTTVRAQAVIMDYIIILDHCGLAMTHYIDGERPNTNHISDRR
jgi:hypothetical protein